MERLVMVTETYFPNLSKSLFLFKYKEDKQLLLDDEENKVANDQGSVVK